ncbi:DUF3293 domain-containing protein [Pusillimonas sp. TS35]|uniref:DUF3293 domain-containing protein n=1 Tax=Paracandidimonas lactea TaxID=2895524 RepID=UPI001367FFA4|nr:DUF3293 domain-containing protein [Paracandidimonas lactea]MYN14908.1 DUF3293 domain-containing protein [Pusillimonas sp. TS35]
MPLSPLTSISPDQQLAYQQARYVIEAPAGTLTLRVGAHSNELAALMHTLGIHSIAILTAWNPGAQPLASQAQNRRAQRALEADAGRMGLHVLRGRNLAEHADTHAEPTLILLNASRAGGNWLAYRYQQLAWVYAGADAIPELIWTPLQGRSA